MRTMGSWKPARAVVLLFLLTTCRTAGAPAPSPSPPTPSPGVYAPTPTGMGGMPLGVAARETDSPLEALEEPLQAIYQQVIPSVVHIRVRSGRGMLAQESTGSGFVYDREGHVVTNYHVVEGAAAIAVTFSDGSEFPARIVGTDPDSDLAVIRVDAPAVLLRPAALGDSRAVRPGQLALAIGNPFGLEGTMTLGIISAVGRVIRPGSRPYSIPNMIQTDASINPGNSGGPLLDSRGQVIGVNTLIFSQSGTSSGVGFAIPVNTVKRIVPVLIAEGRYAHPWLGISGFSVTPLAAQALGLPAEHGALILEVDPQGPAAQAGLRGGHRSINYEEETILVGGDLITAIDGRPVRSMDDLIAYLEEERKPGDEVTLSVLRDGRALEIRVRLAPRPS